MGFGFLRCDLRKEAKNEIYPMKVGIYMFSGQLDNITFVLTFWTENGERRCPDKTIKFIVKKNGHDIKKKIIVTNHSMFSEADSLKKDLSPQLFVYQSTGDK